MYLKVIYLYFFASGYRYGRTPRNESPRAMVPPHHRGIPRSQGGQHDHVLERRTGILRPDPPLQARSHVSIPLSRITNSISNHPLIYRDPLPSR